VKVLVLGEEGNCADYLEWASNHDVTPIFAIPPLLDPNSDPTTWPAAMGESFALEIAREEIDDVISFHDSYQMQLDALRLWLGLPARNLLALRTLSDKKYFKSHAAVRRYITRHVDFPSGLSASEALDAVAEAGLGFPIVLKPSNGFYSAGVIKVSDPGDFANAYKQTRRVGSMLRQGMGHSTIIAEEYIDGKEYAVDGFVRDGRVYPLQLHRKLPPLIGPLFHEIAYLTEPFDEALGVGYRAMLEALVRGIGLDNSPFHAEFRFDAQGRQLILELAPRLCGGGTTTHQQLELCTGIDAYQLLHSVYSDTFEPKKLHEAVALEFDAPIPESGFLQNLDTAVDICRERAVVTLYLDKKDGDYVLAPPLNFETVLTAYFKLDSRAEAEALLAELIEHCTIHTQATKE